MTLNQPITRRLKASSLEAVLAEYLRALEGGQQPDERQILEQHPELAEELRSFFSQSQ